MIFGKVLSGAICAALATSTFAQTTPAPAPAPNPSSLANSVGLMVYPGKGQDAGQHPSADPGAQDGDIVRLRIAHVRLPFAAPRPR